ncbi:hypothetical protein A3F03_01340 [Candidatus Roizmanbacteria bacterium RIFCSPHIGHO2_12_FULL_41_11]|uniref:Toxin n=4 Tax=Candidatus Roizmaniibacteriota TaxID=1752723 RepID=A0A1F7JR80_9BACT|nr:MAG: hypothetical protein US54_C0001G0064 [Candidatus Roizmanbacteria bacterium GW2011_GWA2_37_7]OGK37560.1 MAG: hypothetical protein A3F03_01340 [Candidatus Roizmanbacteria bacterium RIFCSPHIGHO2_12_FULL_41_11]OGK51508.1 MAG: hypothetical protein A2966_01485 [Candidatus Roizmanbacteria bacterium RIFCSPLOWO2_01_FULL_41_22]OGK58106.1 MAG: hypothetical protein A3H86_01275 [Candidatus Roizmanbacteria bacterium RIFCSPLOWO2_02_FULL_41_9]
MDFDIEYSEEKNELLKKTRGVCFEHVKDTLEHGGYITVIEHKNRKKYKHQQILIVNINDYIYAVPFVWDKKKNVAFLKTVYPDRKLTKIYLKK